MEGYNHKEIERKWQEKWQKEKLHETTDTLAGKENFYNLFEFPYPSGNLHVGHWYAYIGSDIFARFMRMQGKNVLFPIGFDAFGLPAENAAIKRNLNPRDWTYDNIEYMRKQFYMMGASVDWSREVVTCDPSYYKWTQWLFLQFFKKELAYQADTTANWCPSCKTVLANEQVIGGHCERCESEVEQRIMKQWNLRITDYADRLLADLKTLDWPEPIKEAQRQWIGKSAGALIAFEIKNQESKIEVFTTRPDTLFGVTYLVLSPEHKEITNLKSQITNWDEIVRYIVQTKKKTERERQENKEKTGVELKGVRAINPGNKEEIPIFVADYVLGGYGTGAIMAVPAHDERDFEFAQKFSLEIRRVISGEKDGLCTGEGILVNSAMFDGIKSEDARKKITEAVEGKMTTTYKMRDWGVSRQRYWGCPIPIIHCSKCGAVAVPESDLPVVLPDISDYLPRDDGRSPLAKATHWVNVKCPVCAGNAERETDTLDTFVDSSWYFLRYTDPKNEREFASQEKQEAWMPVDFYSGGAEHTTMHLLYSRFFHKALFDMGFVKEAEPYKRRMNRGLILGSDGNKMSKSKGNVIDPDEIVDRLGADTVRMYLAFIGPYNEVGSYPWNPNGIVGVRRFLEKVWRIGNEKLNNNNLESLLHKTIKKVTEEIASLKMNTAVSQLMVFANEADRGGVTEDQFEVFMRLLAPFAPHLSEELWHLLGHKTSVHLEPWPEYKTDLLVEDVITIMVQVNGKVRGQFEAPGGLSEAKAVERAKSVPAVEKWLAGKGLKKAVYVPEKLVNLVLDA